MKFLFFKIFQRVFFKNSNDYWNKRYDTGMNSGSGSYGHLADFKARVINDFIDKHAILTAVELGCGDGNQLGLIKYPQYLGLDVSRKVVEICLKSYQNDISKDFLYYDPALFRNNTSIMQCDLALSLDVIYHLTEDDVFEAYMNTLFNFTSKFVIIYASNNPEYNQKFNTPKHIRHRCFTDWVEKNCPDFILQEKIDNPYPLEKGNDPSKSFADFYIFAHKNVTYA